MVFIKAALARDEARARRRAEEAKIMVRDYVFWQIFSANLHTFLTISPPKTGFIGKKSNRGLFLFKQFRYSGFANFPENVKRLRWNIPRA